MTALPDPRANHILRALPQLEYDRLAPHLKSGLLKMYSTRTRGPNVEDQFGALRAKVREHKPHCMIIDPLSVVNTGAVLYLAGAPHHNADGTWEILLGLQNADGILGLDMNLRYNPSAIHVLSVAPTGIGSWTTISNCIGRSPVWDARYFWTAADRLLFRSAWAVLYASGLPAS